jgi:hypothetical protein
MYDIAMLVGTRKWMPCALWLGACDGDEARPADAGGDPPDSGGGTDRPEEALGLASLELSQGTLTPPFRSQQLHYTVAADDLASATTTVTAVPIDPQATVTITHATMDGVAIGGGASPQDVGLLGSERIDIQVETEDGIQRYSVLSLPVTFPRLDVRVATEEAWNGYLFLGNLPYSGAGPDYAPTAFILDRTGTPVWFRTVDSPAIDFKPTEGGGLSYIARGEGIESEQVGWVLDPSYADVATRQPVGDVTMNSHEFLSLPDGHAIVLGTALREADLHAWPGGDPGCCAVVDYHFQELDETGALVFEWSTADHIDELLADLPDQWLAHFWEGLDYAHVNALDFDPADGNWIISVRYGSEVLKVARSETEFRGVTYGPGDIIWRLGGRNSDFEIQGDDRAQGWKGFAQQHCARMPEPGQLLVYDNANWPDIGSTGDSRYVEYRLDEDAMTATKVNEYAIEGSGSTSITGSVARLPDGSTVVGWGTLNSDSPGAPSVTEVTEDGEVVLELALPEGEMSYRAGVGVWDEELGVWRAL